MRPGTSGPISNRLTGGATSRAMATQEQKNVLDENIAEQPLAESMFSQRPSSPGDSLAPGADEELSAHDIFAGDEDFYKLLEDYADDSAADPALAGQSAKDAVRPRRLSSVQKVLVLSIVAVASMLVYTLVTSPSPRPDSPPTARLENVVMTDPQQPVASEPPVTDPVQTEPEQSEQTQPVVSPVQSVSLEVARNFYLQGDYEKASAAYEQLREALPAHEELLRDFLRLRVAVCLLKVGDLEQASRLLVTISHTPSPAVRTVANFRLSLLETLVE